MHFGRMTTWAGIHKYVPRTYRRTHSQTDGGKVPENGSRCDILLINKIQANSNILVEHDSMNIPVYISPH